MSSRAARTTSNPSLKDAIDHRRNAGGRPSTPAPSPAPTPSPARPSSPAPLGSQPAPKKSFLGGLSTGQKALGGLALGGLVTVAVLALTSRKAHASTTPAPSASAQGGSSNNNNGGGGGGGSSNGGGGAPGHLSESQLTPEQISHYKRILLGLGYTGLNADAAGTIGTYTRIALRAFQAAYNTENNSVATTGHSQPGGVGRTELFQPRTLTVDGILGPNTRAGLENYARFEAYR